MKKFIYSIIGLFGFWVYNVNAAMNFWTNKVSTEIQWSTETWDVAIQKLIVNVTMFLYLVAVVFGLWGGFLILTAAWKEDQVKKWRTVIVQALIGLVVIWLASSIVGFVVKNILWVTN